MLSSPSTIAKKLAPVCWQELRNARAFVPKISKIEKPANCCLKPTACATLTCGGKHLCSHAAA